MVLFVTKLQIASLHTTSVAVFLGIDDHLVGFEGDVLEHALHFLHSLLAFASGRTPAKLCNRPFAKRGRDGLALRIVPENALHTTSELIFAAVTHDGLAATSLEGCPCLPSRCPIEPSWPFVGVAKCPSDDMPADSKSRSAH